RGLGGGGGGFIGGGGGGAPPPRGGRPPPPPPIPIVSVFRAPQGARVVVAARCKGRSRRAGATGRSPRARQLREE
ncbi:hypothetical protein, partial [Achromobacter xylosoxidans]|uniref:hypothetical protein n=1 Tax=Alcaligenes xylosoxydans xylosoxydans TaxID=85698 RepID=UPI002367FB8A